MNPGLYVVGTPIGNLDDFAPRAIEALRGVAGILTEDTRRTRILLDRFQLRTPMISCHKFNEASRVEGVLARLKAGEALALVTDSGMPAVSDPGARVVAACWEQGIPVTVLPGPSAVTAAVALCGFAARGFHFEGFLPVKSGGRRKRLEALLGLEVPAVLFESPFRIVRLLEELAALAPARTVFVGRELTKKFEECLRGTARALLARWQGRPPKGEFVVVLAPAREGSPDADGGPQEGGGESSDAGGLVDTATPDGYSGQWRFAGMDAEKDTLRVN